MNSASLVAASYPHATDDAVVVIDEMADMPALPVVVDVDPEI